MPNLSRHPLLPALGAALLCQAGLIGLLRPSHSSTGQTVAGGQETKPVDDTPELMRLTRNLLQSPTAPNPGLAQLLSLPLPPPPELTKPPQPQPQPTSSKAPCPAQTTTATPTSTTPTPAKAKTAQAPAPKSSAPKPTPPTPAAPAAGELPGQPGLALDLARAIAAGKQSLPAEGASPAQVALQRRQWWLTAQESSQLQRAWDQAESAAAPDAWSHLPAGAQLRRVDRESLGALAAGDPRGRTLVNREQITLLWASGPELWLLRLPLAG
jgi:hypothetical protein